MRNFRLESESYDFHDGGRLYKRDGSIRYLAYRDGESK